MCCRLGGRRSTDWAMRYERDDIEMPEQEFRNERLTGVTGMAIFPAFYFLRVF